MASKSDMVMFSESFFNWLQTKLSLQVVALLIIKSTKNFVIHIKNYPSICQNLMSSEWKVTQISSLILLPQEQFTLRWGVNGGLITIDHILAMSEIASKQKWKISQDYSEVTLLRLDLHTEGRGPPPPDQQP